MISRSDVDRLSGVEVYTIDGESIGIVDRIYLDNRSGDPRWVSIKNSLPGAKRLIAPLDRATLSGDLLVIAFSGNQVEGTSRLNVSGTLSSADEDELYFHYGLSFTGRRRVGDAAKKSGHDKSV